MKLRLLHIRQGEAKKTLATPDSGAEFGAENLARLRIDPGQILLNDDTRQILVKVPALYHLSDHNDRTLFAFEAEYLLFISLESDTEIPMPQILNDNPDLVQRIQEYAQLAASVNLDMDLRGMGFPPNLPLWEFEHLSE